jgi:hypothetical protein
MTTATENQDPQLNKVLDRIKKMMALANCDGATEGERAAALKMSFNLLAKHNLSMVDVDARNSTPQENRESQKATFVVYPWARQIAGLVGDLFFCNYYYMRSNSGKQATHVFIGKESNAVTAQYMSEFVVKSVCREAARLYGSAITPEARCFAIGVVATLRTRIREMKDAMTAESGKGTELALVNLYASERKANELWLAEQGVKLRTTQSQQKGITSSAAYGQGKDFGSKVSLSPQVGTTASKVKMLA